MRVLVACEFSGVVREAFRKRGHDAWSCDLCPASDGSPFHLQGDLKYALPAHSNGFYFRQLKGHKRWDLGIFHPPCTRLTNAGVRWLYTGGKGKTIDPDRWSEMEEAASFFELCLGRGSLNTIQRLAVENPIMHAHAAELINSEPDQIIQPWQFGHKEMKATCLWLRGLPKLQPTNVVGPPPKDKEQRKSWARVHRESPGPDRWKRRSITYHGIAEAMAEQWGTT